MTSKTLVILAGSALLIGIGAYVVTSGRSGGVGTALSGGKTLMFPELAARGDGVTSITVRTGAEEVVVQKAEQAGGGGAWVLASRGGYPADLEKVRNLVEALSQVKIAETKTSKPESYGRLGVQDVDAPGSGSTLVTLKAGPEVAASMIVGLTPTTRGDVPMQQALPGVFARKAGEAQAVLLEKNIEVPKGVTGWMKSDILALEAQRVRSAVLVQAAEAVASGAAADAPEETLKLSKQAPEDANFEVEAIPAGRALRSPNAPGPIATVLSYVTIEDAAPISTVEGLTPVSKGTFKTFDGVVIETRLFTRDGKAWLTLAASYEAPPMPEVPTAPEAAEGPEPADPKAEAEKRYQETAERAQKEVQDLQAKLSAWAFQLPDFKAKQMRTRVEDLLAPAAAEQPAPGGATVPAGDEGAGPGGEP